MVKIVQRYQSERGETFDTALEAHQDDLAHLFNGLFGNGEEGREKTAAVVRYVVTHIHSFADACEAIRTETQRELSLRPLPADAWSSTPPIRDGANDLPPGVYWSSEGDNFYGPEKKGMGSAFYNQWYPRRDEFPTGPE